MRDSKMLFAPFDPPDFIFGELECHECNGDAEMIVRSTTGVVGTEQPLCNICFVDKVLAEFDKTFFVKGYKDPPPEEGSVDLAAGFVVEETDPKGPEDFCPSCGDKTIGGGMRCPGCGWHK